MFRAVGRSSSGALTVFAASGLHTPVVTDRSEFPLRLDYGRSPQAYVNQRLQIQLELLMMSGVPLETCWAFNERWNNKFSYKVASCWLFLLKHILVSQVHCVWQVVKTPTIILNNAIFSVHYEITWHPKIHSTGRILSLAMSNLVHILVRGRKELISTTGQ
jgi:hypothetical protein